MYERCENQPPRPSSTSANHPQATGMYTDTYPDYSQPQDKPQEEESRTTSPTFALQSNSEFVTSPVAASQGTLSTSSPLSHDPVHFQGHRQLHPGTYSNSSYSTPPFQPVAPPIAMSGTGSPIHGAQEPLAVRSASWAAPETQSQDASSVSVPAVITTNYDAAGKHKGIKKKQHQNTKKGEKQPAVAGKPGGDSVTARRQKRLERNRESARLSRRRRKQYLEVLEEKVTHLSIEMDKGRRAHAAAAIETVLAKRRALLEQQQHLHQPMALHLLDSALNRTSGELSVLGTFQMQQLKSFALPAQAKFIMWLTLQGDLYFRGGRAASERLSAARIGERMLQSGNDKVSPLNSMWPLFCNEVGLSYDQEERVRQFQRTLLQESPTWLERHTARASSLVMKSFHDSVNAIGCRLRSRERKLGANLTQEQRLKFAVWAEKNGGRIRQKLQPRRATVATQDAADGFKLDQSQHVAANLYILNNRLQQILKGGDTQEVLVLPAQLRKLSRRPSFESLGQQKDENGNTLARQNSFASSGSLKQSVSSLSIVSENGEDRGPHAIRPEDGECAAAPHIDRELGFVKTIIPRFEQPVLPPAPAPVALPPPPVVYRSKQPYATPPQGAHAAHPAPPTPYTVQPTGPPQPPPHPGGQPMTQPMAPHTVLSQPPSIQPAPGVPGPIGPPPSAPYQYYTAPNSSHPPQPMYAQHHHHHAPPEQSQLHAQIPQPVYSAPPDAVAPPPGPQHARKSSFLPPHMSVVPEEMFPTNDGAAEDFLMSLIDDGDWAIGEGVDMETGT